MNILGLISQLIGIKTLRLTRTTLMLFFSFFSYVYDGVYHFFGHHFGSYFIYLIFNWNWYIIACTWIFWQLSTPARSGDIFGCNDKLRNNLRDFGSSTLKSFYEWSYSVTRRRILYLHSKDYDLWVKNRYSRLNGYEVFTVHRISSWAFLPGWPVWTFLSIRLWSWSLDSKSLITPERVRVFAPQGGL